MGCGCVRLRPAAGKASPSTFRWLARLSCQETRGLGFRVWGSLWIGTHSGNIRDNGKENGNYYNGLYRVYWDYIGIMEKRRETTGNIGL